MTEPLPPVDEAVTGLLANTQGDVANDAGYRPVLAASLLMLGYTEADTNTALNRLYRMN